MNKRALLAALAAAAALGACGGDNAESTPPTPPTAAGSDVPQSALASPQAYTDYVGSISPSDTATPLQLGSITAPVSETAAPETLH